MRNLISNRRVRGNLIYLKLHDNKVWVEYDGLEQGLVTVS
nr:element excision factor XisI family protein [Okeania sp. SIO1I7]